VTADRVRVYASTVLDFSGDPAGSIDLRRPLSRRDRRLLADHGLTGPFAIVTAWNPRGRTDHARNPERQSNLESEVAASGLAWVRLDGCSPDGVHREASLAVSMPEEEAQDLAVRFEQDALFWYDGDAFWLVGAIEPLGRVRLPLELPSER
jgi:hypothetical protein